MDGTFESILNDAVGVPADIASRMALSDFVRDRPEAAAVAVPRMMPTVQLTPSLDKRFAATEYVVEATPLELAFLFSENVRSRAPLPWVDDGAGVELLAGWLFGVLPITLALSWADINGHKVAFWGCVSRVRDRDVIEAWFAAHCSPRCGDGGIRRADADSFHLCLEYCRRPPARA